MGFKAWALDFAPNNYGDDPFPKAAVSDAELLRWRSSDWDPALRFWSLPWDPTLREWLKSEDTSQWSITAARELAGEHTKWRFDEAGLLQHGWLDPSHLAWKSTIKTTAQAAIKAELEEMFQLMEDDRDRWLFEINQQADGLAGYFVSLLGMDSVSKPWTMELIRCGLAMGNVVYMNYKAVFKRVRPSAICPGLIPPFGPPRHPSFPSGHSFLGHFIALLLMEIDTVKIRFGEDTTPRPAPPPPPGPPLALPNGVRFRQGVKPCLGDVMRTDVEFGGPLLWLGNRLARNRERLGVHYRSDSDASRWLAGAICALLVTDKGVSTTTTGTPPVTTWPDLEKGAKPPSRAAGTMTPDELIDSPALRYVLNMARAEWA